MPDHGWTWQKMLAYETGLTLDIDYKCLVDHGLLDHSKNVPKAFFVRNAQKNFMEFPVGLLLCDVQRVTHTHTQERNTKKHDLYLHLHSVRSTKQATTRMTEDEIRYIAVIKCLEQSHTTSTSRPFSTLCKQNHETPSHCLAAFWLTLAAKVCLCVCARARVYMCVCVWTSAKKTGTRHYTTIFAVHHQCTIQSGRESPCWHVLWFVWQCFI